ncbi:YnjH family protein [Vibrio makurazakiensis]|uniref:DUF1496 domain-containing protein n=1 Tax=Vibrio makurazakiensis TaxID=2910250 RepID=UPI003D0BC0C0
MEHVIKSYSRTVVMSSVLSLFLVSSAFANKVISTPGRSAIVVTDAKGGGKICYYEDKAYSLGAVLNISGVLIECVSENDFELNGAVKWQQLDQKSEPQ